MPILCVLVCMCRCPPHIHTFTYTCIRCMYTYAEASKKSSYCNFTANSHNLQQYCEQLRICRSHFLADANRYMIQIHICMCTYMCNVRMYRFIYVKNPQYIKNKYQCYELSVLCAFLSRINSKFANFGKVTYICGKNGLKTCSYTQYEYEEYVHL